MRVRRIAAGVVVMAMLAGACSHGGARATGPQTTTTGAPGTTAQGQPAGSSTQSLVKTLADAGVATVADETSTTPEVAVTGARIFTLTAWQVANINVELSAHDGISGADLDAMLPMPPHYPKFADIIGGWIIAQKDTDAVQAGRLLGAVDWKLPEQVVFPTAVTTLFMADMLQHISAAQTTASPSASASDASYHGAPLVTVEPAGIVEAPCSTVSTFVNNILDQAFSLLKLDAEKVSTFVNGAVGGGVAGLIAGGVAGFLVGFWNHVVDLAEQSVQSLIQAVEQPVLNAMATAIGAVAVFTIIRSYLKAWTTKVNPDPGENSFPLAPSHNPGSFTVVIDRNAEVEDWPPQLVDCAKVAGVPLPTLAKEGSPVFWDIGQQTPGLVTTGEPRGTLDKSFTQTLKYETGNETPKDREHAIVVTPTVTADVRVRRTEIEELRKFVTAYLTSKVPKLIASVVDPILEGYIELATEFLDTLTAVTGSTRIVVSHHMPKPPPPCTSAGGVIPVGHYSATVSGNIHISLHIPGAPVEAGHGDQSVAGDIDLTSDGKTVTGTIRLGGGGSSAVGISPGPIFTDSSHGGMKGTISGSAADPRAAGTLAGVDEIAGHTSAGFHTSLPLTSVSCTSISGSIVDLFNEIFKAYNVAQYVKASGSATWTAPRTG